MSLLDNLLGSTEVAFDGDVLTKRKKLNYVGDGVLVEDNPVTGSTDVTILTGATGVLCSALDALVGTVDKASITCDGRLARDDGGGGTFVWDASSTATRDGGVVFGTNVSGRWKRVFHGSVVDPAWWGATSSTPATVRAAIQSALASLSTYAGIDFGSRTYDLGTRTGASDGALQLVLSGLQDKTLISRGATFTVQTTNFVGSYAPTMFRVANSKRISFQGTWNVTDTRTWSMYAEYGQSLDPVDGTWGGFAGICPFLIQEQCEDIRFGDLRFKNTRYGVFVSGIDGALPDEANRSRRISIGSLHAEDTLYPLLCAENGDDLSCPQLNTVNCLRPFDFYGVDNVRVSANIRNSIQGFSSIVTRKKRDTSNVDIDLRYHSDDGYPQSPFAMSLAPITGTGDPIVENVHVKIVCSMVTEDAAREQQYAANVIVYAPRTEEGAIVESNYTATTGKFKGITLDIDKGNFEQYLNASPVANFSTAYKKIPIKLITRTRDGGTNNYPANWVSDDTLYRLQRKMQFDAPTYYEFRSSDTNYSGQAFPISDWAPWKNDSQVAISTDYGTQYWKWVRIGPLVQYELMISITASAATLAADHPGNFYFQLPYLPDLAGGSNPPYQEFGSVIFTDASAAYNYYLGTVWYNGGTDLALARLKVHDNAGTQAFLSPAYQLTNTYPVAPTTGDKIRLTCSYLIRNGF